MRTITDDPKNIEQEVTSVGCIPEHRRRNAADVAARKTGGVAFAHEMSKHSRRLEHYGITQHVRGTLGEIVR